jgi:hypothetical protein
MNNELFIIIVILFVLWFINENTKNHNSIDKFENDDTTIIHAKLDAIIAALRAMFGLKYNSVHQQHLDLPEPRVVHQRHLDLPEPRVVHQRHLDLPEPHVVHQRHLDLPEPRVVHHQPRLQEFHHRREQGLNHDLSSRLSSASSSSRHSTEHKNMKILDNVQAHDSNSSQHSPLL